MNDINRLIFIIILLLGWNEMIYGGNSRYRLIYRDDPSTSVVIGWEQTSGTNPAVYYDTQDHGTSWSQYPYQKMVDRISYYRDMTNCFAVLTGLQPGTSYYFVIKDDEGVSRRFWFKTITSDYNDTLSIIAGGDSRTDAPAWIPGYGDESCRPNRQAANKMVSKLRPDFVAFGGDFVLNLDLIVWASDANQEWKDWLDDWQLTISTDGRMYPLMISQGNHEAATDIYNIFYTPGSDIYYALSFGGNLLRWYTLNTEVSISGSQTTWLENDLNANPNYIWRFAQYHNPIRPHVSDKDEGTDSYTYWAPLFQRKKVQLVVESDAHTTKYTWPVIPCFSCSGTEEGFARNDTLGTVYIGEGTWGAPMRDADDNKPWTRASEKVAVFQWIFVSRFKTEVRSVKYGNADAVSSVDDNHRFVLPASIDLWNPPNGNLIVIPNRTLSSAKEILSFSFPQQTGPGTINSLTHEVHIEVGYGTGLTQLTPSISISPRAVLSPPVGQAMNFTNTVIFRVMAEDLSYQDWRVFVTEAFTPSSKNDITSFLINEAIAPGVIDTINHTVSVNVPIGTNLTALVPLITVSPFAAITPWSGIPQDFSSQVNYTVRAQNGQTQTWAVFVNETEDTLTLSVKNHEPSVIAAIYPNPSIGKLTIKFSHIPDNLTIKLADIKGNLLKKFTCDNTFSDIFLIDLDHLKKGVYYLMIYNSDIYEIHKFVLNK